MVSPEYANDAEVLMFLSECWRCQFGAFFASLRLNKHLNLSRMKNFFKTACLTFIICYMPISNMFIIIYTVCHHLKPFQSISASKIHLQKPKRPTIFAWLHKNWHWASFLKCFEMDYYEGLIAND